MEGLNDAFFILFPYVVVSTVYVFSVTFSCWIYHEEYYSLIVQAQWWWSVDGKPISPLMDVSHVACCPVLASSIFSASPTESATVIWCCDTQEIAPFAIMEAFTNVEWQSSLFLPQSESEYPINPAFELLLHLISSSIVSQRYLNIHFTYLMCKSIGLFLYDIIVWLKMLYWV